MFCGSKAGARPEYRLAAQAMAAALLVENIGLVYGGGGIGLMGEVADGVLAGGGEVIGVIPRHMTSREVAHQGLSDLRVVGSMHDRKTLMYDLADGFVALPGGLGTLEELFEVTTWSQLGLHVKPTGLLDVAGYFSLLSGFLDHTVTEGFVNREHRRLLIVEEESTRLLGRLAAFEPPPLPRWLDEQGR